MNIGLYVARRESGMTQKEVAEMLGIHHQSYCNKEKGHTDFTIKQGLQLTRIFDKTLDELFGGNDDDKRTTA